MIAKVEDAFINGVLDEGANRVDVRGEFIKCDECECLLRSLQTRELKKNSRTDVNSLPRTCSRPIRRAPKMTVLIVCRSIRRSYSGIESSARASSALPALHSTNNPCANNVRPSLQTNKVAEISKYSTVK